MKCAVTYKAVGPPFVPHGKIHCEGGGADGKRFSEVYLPFRGEPGHYRYDFAPHRPKSVLAARLAPRRLT